MNPSVIKNKNSRKKNLILPLQINKKTNQNTLVTNFHRKSKKAVGIIEHNDEKTNALR